MSINKKKKKRIQSLGEEIANSITHGIGAGLSIAALVILVVFAALQGDAWKIVSFSIYGVSLFALYLTSTLYHSFTNPKLKQFFHVLDHSAIFLLIAGTYTPILLISMRGVLGWTLFGLIWALALGGIVFKIFFFEKFKILSVLFYVGMGWLVVIAGKPVLEMVPTSVNLWLLIGGIFYTVGVVFYITKKIPFQHGIWHLFVLGGSVSHFFGMLQYF
ncbi:hemolysin III family protein [bacterium]|nr:hemolysin III family protein [bacterium]